MIFYTKNEYESMPGQVICRYSPLKILVVFLLFGMSVVAFICAFLSKNIPIAGSCFFAPGLLLALLICASLGFDIINSIKQENWLLATTSDALLVQYRHLGNSHFSDDDKQIANIPFSEIESVRPAKCYEYIFSQKGNKQKVKVIYLEVTLKNNDCDKLRDMLKIEREKTKLDVMRNTKFFGHRTIDPVIIITLENQFRVVLNNTNFSARKISNALAGKANVLEQITYTEKLNDKNLSPQELDEQVLKLANSGNTISAIAMIRSAYNVGIKEAKDYIEDLEKQSI